MIPSIGTKQPSQQDQRILRQIYNSVTSFCRDTLQDEHIAGLLQQKFLEKVGPVLEITLDNEMKPSGQSYEREGEQESGRDGQQAPLYLQGAAIQTPSIQDIINIYNSTQWQQQIKSTLQSQERKRFHTRMALQSPIENRQPNMQHLVRHLGNRKSRRRLARMGQLEISHQMKHLVKVYGHREYHEDHSESAQSQAISNVRFDHTGEILITGDSKGFIKTWSVSTARLIYEWKLHSEEINDLDISSCNRFLASVSDDGCLKIVDFIQKREVCVVEEPSKLVVCKWVRLRGQQVVVVISENSTLLAVEERQFTSPVVGKFKINLFNIINEQKRILTRKLKLSGMDVNPQGQMVVGTSNGDIIVLRPQGSQNKESILDYYSQLDYKMWNAHKANAHLVLWANRSDMLVTGSLVGGAKVWTAESTGGFKETGHIQYEEIQTQVNDYKCWAVCWSARDSYVVVSLSKRIREAEEPDSHKSIVKVFSTRENKSIHTLELLEITQWILIVECHPSQEELCVAADLEGNVIIWDIVKGVALNIFRETGEHVSMPSHPNLIYDGRFSPDGKTFVVSTFYGSFSLYGNRDPHFYQHAYPQQFFQVPPADTLCDANLTPYPMAYDPPLLNQSSLASLHRHLFQLYDYNCQINRRLASDKKQHMEKNMWLNQQHSRVYAANMGLYQQSMAQIETIQGHHFWIASGQPLPLPLEDNSTFKRLVKTSTQPEEPLRRRRPILHSPQPQSPRRPTRQTEQRTESPDDHPGDSSQSRARRFLKRQKMRDQTEQIEEPSMRRSTRVSARVQQSSDSSSEDQEMRRMSLRNRQQRSRRIMLSPDACSDSSVQSSEEDVPCKRVKKEEPPCARCHQPIVSGEGQECGMSCGKHFHQDCFSRQCLVYNDQLLCLGCLQQKQGRLNRRNEEQACRRDYLRSALQSNEKQSVLSSWLPQIDDKVYFLFQPYESLVQKHFYYLDHLSIDLSPQNTLPLLQSPLCTVAEISYSFTKTPPKKYLDPQIVPQVFMVLTLAHQADYFKIAYLPKLPEDHHQPLVPKEVYEQAQEKYSTLVSLQSVHCPLYPAPLLFSQYSQFEKRFESEYLLVQLQVAPAEEQNRRHLRKGTESLQKVLLCKWNLTGPQGEEAVLASPLEDSLLNSTFLTDLQSHVEQNRESPFFPEFLDPVDMRKYPSYMNVVHVQFYINRILKRLGNQYYRSSNQLLHEIEMISRNVSSFNEHHSPIANHGQNIVRNLKKRVHQVEDSERASALTSFLRAPMNRVTRLRSLVNYSEYQ